MIQPLAADTAPHIERHIVELLRAMPAGRKLALARDMNRMADALALAGLRQRHPTATARELALELALQRLGPNQRERGAALLGGATLMPDVPLDPLTIALRAGALLDELSIPYVIGGSVAAIVHGEYRMTRNLDVVIDLAAANARKLAQALSGDFILRPADISDALMLLPEARDNWRTRATFCAFDRASGFQLDVFLASGRPFEQAQFERAAAIAIPGEPGGTLRVASAEDTILAKLEWYRMTSSDRQWRDIQAILRMQSDTLDTTYLQRWAGELGVADLLHWAQQGERPPAPGEDPQQQRMF